MGLLRARAESGKSKKASRKKQFRADWRFWNDGSPPLEHGQHWCWKSPLRWSKITSSPRRTPKSRSTRFRTPILYNRNNHLSEWADRCRPTILISPIL